jgi:Phospholipase_D-nuclease N-terminal
MGSLIAIGVICAALAFCLWQFCDLMRRRDDEFPGRFDKPIWAAAILFANVLGAFAYWLSKQSAAPVSSESLRREYAAALQQGVAGSSKPASAG